MVKLSKKIWKCTGSFVKNAPTCDESIVTTRDDKRLEYGKPKFYLCENCKNWNIKWQNQVRDKMLASLLRHTI